MPRTLAQNAQYINETIKPAIKSAIEAQGVTVPSTDSFLDYADRIGEIEGGGSGYQLKDLPSGSISTVNDAAELPLNALKVSVEAVQSGSGTPSPSNIRPIHGWDSGEIDVVGKNLMQNTMTADVDYNGVLWRKNTDGSITVSGIPTGNSYVLNALKAYIKDLNQTYIISGLAGVTNVLWEYVRLYDINDNQLEVVGVQSANDVTIDYLQSYPLTAYITVNPKRISNGVECSGTIKSQIEIGTQATTYEPYQVNQYTQQFPTTIYGAEWDVVGGMLSQTDGYIASYNGESLPSTWISDRDEYASGTTPTIGAEVVYKLATPITIDLSPLSIRMLEGTNNIYADCGDVIEGEYFSGEGGGGEVILNADDIQICTSQNMYLPQQPLDVNITELGYYVVSLHRIRDDEKWNSLIYYDGVSDSTININYMSEFRLHLTPTTIGCQYYGGNYEDVYVKLSKTDNSQVYI